MLKFNLAVEVSVDQDDFSVKTYSLESSVMVFKEGDEWKVVIDNVNANKAWSEFKLDPDMWGCYNKLTRNLGYVDLSEFKTEEQIIEFFTQYEFFETVYEYSFTVQVWELGTVSGMIMP